jgi:hypothetical protein
MGTVYAGTTNGLFKSDNGGASWFNSGTGLGNTNISSIMVDPADHNTVYAATNGGGAFKSVDGGVTWRPVGTTLNPFPPLGTPVFLSATLGDRQSALVNTNFATPLEATVRDSSNSPVNGVNVTFSVPTLGPSATFPGNQTTVSAMTNVLGIASPPALTANGAAGSYLGSATLGGSIPPAFYTLTNILPVSNSTFSVPNRGGMQASTAGLGALTSGYATIVPDNGKTTPAGVAITGFRFNGIQVTEFAVPAVRPILSGRLYVEIAGAVNTGLILANANPQAASISWYATNLAGTDAFSGGFSINSNTQMAVFLNQAPFNLSNFNGTLTFTSNVGLATVGLRLLTNERGESIITSMPVFDMSAPLSNGTAIVPIVVDGDGFTSAVVLENPTDATITGSIQFLDPDGIPLSLTANGQTSSSFSYSIPRRTSFKLTTAGTSATDVDATARVVPDMGQNTPFVFEIVSSRQNNVTATEVAAVATTGSVLRTYVEAVGSVSDELGTVVAVANASANPGLVTFELTDLTGNSLAPAASIDIPGNGQISDELEDLFQNLPIDVRGVLRISSTTTVSAMNIRIHVNERDEYLFVSLPVTNEADPASSTPSIIPHFSAGGGYSVQFVVFSGVANQSTTGQIQFFNQSGLPLNLDLNARPSILVISPSSGVVGTMISAVITGVNLSGATGVTFSGSGVTAAIGGGGNSTSLPITISVGSLAEPTTRTATVTTTAGTSPVFTGFTVTTGVKRRGGQLTSQ